MIASPLATFVFVLKRRRVCWVAAFYGGIAFIIIQIIDAAAVGNGHDKSRFTGYGADTGFHLSTGRQRT